MVKLKLWYLNMIEKKKRNIFEWFIFCILYLVSLVYGFCVRFRNYLYDRRIIKEVAVPAKVISIGNISWAGSGKTSFAIWLYKHLTAKFKVAILRRGYGKDEEKLINEITNDLFSSPKREVVAAKKASLFDVFLLDDGFQYRKLKRDINIVLF